MMTLGTLRSSIICGPVTIFSFEMSQSGNKANKSPLHCVGLFFFKVKAINCCDPIKVNVYGRARSLIDVAVVRISLAT